MRQLGIAAGLVCSGHFIPLSSNRVKAGHVFITLLPCTVARKIKRIHIDGKPWRVSLKRPPSKDTLDGLCVYDTRTIYIHPHALTTCGIETICHEIFHARMGDVCEEAVAEVGRLTGEVCGWAAKHNNGVIV